MSVIVAVIEERSRASQDRAFCYVIDSSYFVQDREHRIVMLSIGRGTVLTLKSVYVSLRPSPLFDLSYASIVMYIYKNECVIRRDTIKKT